MGARLLPSPRREERESVTTSAARWWRHGWLIDQDGSGAWEPCERPAHPQARDFAARYHGRIVRLRRLPVGYGATERLGDGAIVPVDPGPFGIEAVLSEGWPSAPPFPEGAVLIGPVDFLVAAQRRGEPAPRGRVDWLRLAVWAGAVALSLAAWLALFLLIRALVW
jgi:hypothetical protein